MADDMIGTELLFDDGKDSSARGCSTRDALLLGLSSMGSLKSRESSAGRIRTALGMVRSLTASNQDAATIDDPRYVDASASVIVPNFIDRCHGIGEPNSRQHALRCGRHR